MTATQLFTVVVDAGPHDRHSPLVRVPLPPAGPAPIAVRDTSSGIVVACQVDGDALALVVPGDLPAGQKRTFEATDEPVTAPQVTSAAVKLDRVILQVNGGRFADYLVVGGRRPYFWPVLSSTGATVVRGQGSSDHPHHTGLALSYGGHSEDGSTNIWSDWDEPPYGPGGRMVHRGFRSIITGPVFGELVQDLTLVNSDGDAFADETRTIRWWWADTDTRFIEFDTTIHHIHDHGVGPYLLMARTPEPMGVPAEGVVTSSDGAPVPERVYRVADRYRAAWVDASGPSGGTPPPAPAGPPEDLPDLREEAATYRAGSGPVHGIAVFDHPTNHGFPNVIGQYAMVQQITQSHYPTAEQPHGPFSFRQRVLVHAGDAEQGRVASAAADFATPCTVTTTT